MGRDYVSSALSVETSLLAETFPQKTDEGCAKGLAPGAGTKPPMESWEFPHHAGYPFRNMAHLYSNITPCGFTMGEKGERGREVISIT